MVAGACGGMEWDGRVWAEEEGKGREYSGTFVHKVPEHVALINNQ